MNAPKIYDQEAYETFKKIIRNAYQQDPDSKWYGGYVAYEWKHLRYMLEALPLPLQNAHTLEFGCNIGASSIILAHLGSQVSAVDVNIHAIDATNAHIKAYDKQNLVTAYHFSDTSTLAFSDETFDLITANSVLEYVAPDMLAKVLAELDRVLKPNGIILITGTSNRLFPKEVHSQKWFVNYMPLWVDKYLGYDIQRGVSPFSLLKTLKNYQILEKQDLSKSYLDVRKKMQWPLWKIILVKSLAYILSIFNLTPSMLTPNIYMTLKKIKERP